MSRRNLSRDQKRRQKLAKRARPSGIQPYEGKKYRDDRWVPVIMAAEIGILESYKLTDEKLTDRQVSASLEYLVRQLRGTHPEPPKGNPQTDGADGQPEDLVASRIKDRWHPLFLQERRPAPDDLAGCLRTILSSIRTWSRPVPDSRGYLHFIEGFLAKGGVRVEAVPPEGQLAWEEDEEEPTDAELLTDLGLEWIETHDPAARRRFLDEADSLLEDRQAGVVIEVCQHLIGRLTNEPVLVKEITEVIQKAWKLEPP